MNGTLRDSFPPEYERYTSINDWRIEGYLVNFQKLYLELFDLTPEHFLKKIQLPIEIEQLLVDFEKSRSKIANSISSEHKSERACTRKRNVNKSDLASEKSKSLGFSIGSIIKPILSRLPSPKIIPFVELGCRYVIEKYLFQNGNFIGSLFLTSPYLSEVLSVPPEMLNDLFLSFAFEEAYISITSLYNNGLWHHLPWLSTLFAFKYLGPSGLRKIATVLSYKLGLMEKEKASFEPWFNLVGRVCLAVFPKFNATKEGLHYRYPSLSGSFETYAKDYTLKIKDNIVNLEKKGVLKTPDGKYFEGTYFIRFSLHETDRVSKEYIEANVTNFYGEDVFIRLIIKRGQYGPEVTVQSSDKELEERWAKYFHQETVPGNCLPLPSGPHYHKSLESVSLDSTSSLVNTSTFNTSLVLSSGSFCPSNVNPPFYLQLQDRALIRLHLGKKLKVLYKQKDSLSIFQSKDETRLRLQLSINKTFTQLTLIGQKEKEGKKDLLSQSDPGHFRASEKIFSAKNPIKIEDIFELSELRNKTKKHVRIEGAAGIGKSAFCQYIAYRWSQGDLWPQFKMLFWLNLKKLTPETDISLMLADKFELEKKELEKLKVDKKSFGENVLLILDGYDELSADVNTDDPDEGSLAYTFKELKNAFPNILMTTRPTRTNFDTDFNLEILGFDNSNIKDYINRFFDEDKISAGQLIDFINKNWNAKSLAYIPLNLSMMCVLIKEDPQALDDNITLTSLYQKTENQFYKWYLTDRNREIKDDTILLDDHLRAKDTINPLAQVMEEIAWRAIQRDNCSVYTTQKEISQMISKNVTLSDIKSLGLYLIENQEGRFIHLTFEDYFSARYLERLYGTDPIQAGKELIKSKLNPKFSLVIPMVAGSLPEEYAQNFFNDLEKEPHDFAYIGDLVVQARCFEEYQKRSEIFGYDKFIHRVADFIENQVLASDALYELLNDNLILINHPKIVDAIVTLLKSDKSKLRLSLVLNALKKIATKNANFDKKIVKAVTSILKKPEEKFSITNDATIILREVAKAEQEQSQKALKALLMVLETSQGGRVTHILIEIAHQREDLCDTIIKKAFAILTTSKDNNVLSHSIKILSEIEVESQGLLKEIENALFRIYQDPDVHILAKGTAIDALGTIALKQKEWPQKVLDLCFKILKEKQFSLIHVALKTIGVITNGVTELQKPEGIIHSLLSSVNKNIIDYHGLAFGYAIAGMSKRSNENFVKIREYFTSYLKKDTFSLKYFIMKLFGGMTESGQLFPEDTTALLTEYLGEDVSSLKCFIINLFGRIAESGQLFPEDTTALLTDILINNPDMSIKNAAVYALGEITSQGIKPSVVTLEVIINALHNDNTNLQKGVIYALKKIGIREGGLPDNAIQAIASTLKNYNNYTLNVQRAAAEAFGEIASSGIKLPDTALDALINALYYCEPNVKNIVAYAIRRCSLEKTELRDEAVYALLDVIKVSWMKRCKTESREQIMGGDVIAARDTLKEIAKTHSNLPSNVAQELLAILKLCWEYGDDEINNMVYIQTIESILKTIFTSHKEFFHTSKTELIELIEGPTANLAVMNSVIRILGSTGNKIFLSNVSLSDRDKLVLIQTSCLVTGSTLLITDSQIEILFRKYEFD